MAFTLTHGIKTDGSDSGEMVGSKCGDIAIEQQLNTVYSKHHLNAVNLYPEYTESY